ncbi:hypothetical protein LTR84_008623 [Exophiala bonariae]|uniref:G-patch domain-containing protein n=1 Tax=Exophiala bonariae TaxID=1690606 RepID=A0AAV9MX84_9EURO|nr:hypothetical protein LTR84_008623 [Exophiala bonariae]
MDAHAHLLSLGWAGPGHALDSKPYQQKGHRGLAYDPAKSSNTGNGLVKPLLVSQRKGRLGIGKKAHEPQAGNEWWLKGFESALGNVGKSESERSSGASTPVPYSNNGRKHTGLYSFFIKGQQMAGTIGEDGEIIGCKRRKIDLLDSGHDQDDSSSSRQTTATGSKRSKPAPAVEFELVSEYIALRDKDEKRKKRSGRLSPVTEFRQVAEYIQTRSEKETKKRKRQSEEEESEMADTPLPDNEASAAVETKEERRERRRQRREEKAKTRAERTKKGSSKSETVQDGSDSEEDPAVKAARRAERKKRKAEKVARLLE